MGDEEKILEEHDATPETPERDPQTVVDEAIAAAERLERANAAMEKTLHRLESLSVERTLGGRGNARAEREDSDEEYADKVLRGA